VPEEYADRSMELIQAYLAGVPEDPEQEETK
jgi:hypothetical protein